MLDTIFELRDFYSRHGFCYGGAIAEDKFGDPVKFGSPDAASFCFYGAIGRMALADCKAFSYERVMERRYRREANLEAAIKRYMSERMGCSDEVISGYDAIVVSFQYMIGDDREALDRFFDAFDQSLLAVAD